MRSLSVAGQRGWHRSRLLQVIKVFMYPMFCKPTKALISGSFKGGGAQAFRAIRIEEKESCASYNIKHSQVRVVSVQ